MLLKWPPFFLLRKFTSTPLVAVYIRPDSNNNRRSEAVNDPKRHWATGGIVAKSRGAGTKIRTSKSEALVLSQKETASPSLLAPSCQPSLLAQAC